MLLDTFGDALVVGLVVSAAAVAAGFVGGAVAILITRARTRRHEEEN